MWVTEKYVKREIVLLEKNTSWRSGCSVPSLVLIGSEKAVHNIAGKPRFLQKIV